MKFIDISDDQNGLNFDLVKKAGVKGCVVEVCEGTETLTYYPKFFNACTAQDLYIGAACLSVAGDEEEAEYEAETLITAFEKCGSIEPSLYFWIAFNSTLADLMDSETLASVANTFITTCNHKGYLAGVCAEADVLERMEKAGLKKGILKWSASQDGAALHYDCWNIGTETFGTKEISVNEWY